MLLHHLGKIGPESRRCALRQAKHGMDPREMTPIDLHLLESLAVLADRAEMLVQPDDQRHLLRQLCRQVIEIVQGLQQRAAAADDDRVNDDLLAHRGDLAVHVVLDQLVGERDIA
jgi:hypothetical protein